MEKIDNSQELKKDNGKLLFNLVFEGLALVLKELAKILTFGTKKYKADSWQQVEPERYKHALYRHLNEWAMGNKIDEESGELHISHALCNLCFLVWFEIKGVK